MSKKEKGVIPAIFTQLTAHNRKQVFEVNNEPSKTVQGQTMTILEMIQRHRKGLPIDESKGALYHEGDEPLQNLDHMDLIDRQAYTDSVADALVEVRTRLEEQAKTKAEKQYLDKVDQAVREKLAQLSKSKEVITDIKEE